MVLWQNLLPQVLCSLKNPREHGTSSFPIFNAPNRTCKKKKKNVCCCQKVHHSTPLLNGLLAAPSVHPSDGSCGHCPRIYRGFPRRLSCYFHFPLLYPYSSESHILASVQKHCVYFPCVFFLKLFLGCRVIWSEIIRWAKDSKSQVNRQCESSHGAAGRTRWIVKADSCRSDLWVPSLWALMTRLLSAETEKHGISHPFISPY